MKSEYKLNVVSVSFNSVILNKPFEWLIGRFSRKHTVFLKIKYRMKILLMNVGNRDFTGGELIFSGKPMIDSIKSDNKKDRITTIKIGKKTSVQTSSFEILNPITELTTYIKDEDGIEVCFCNKDGSYIRDGEKYRYEIPIYVAPISIIIPIIALFIPIIGYLFNHPLFKDIFQAIVNRMIAYIETFKLI